MPSLFLQTMRNCRLLNVIVTWSMMLISITPSQLTADPSIPDEIIEAVNRQTTQLLTQYTPDKYFVLNLGITTTLTSAFLRRYIPSPAMQDKYYMDIAVTRLKQVRQLNSDQLKTFFDQILPSREVLGDRTIVLNRVLWEGQTMEAFLPHLIQYLQENRPGTAVTYRWIVQRSLGSAYQQLHNLDPSGKVLVPGTAIADQAVADYFISIMYDRYDNRSELAIFQKRQELLPADIAALHINNQAWPEQTDYVALDQHVQKFMNGNECLAYRLVYSTF